MNGAVFNAIKQKIEAEKENFSTTVSSTNTYSGGTTVAAGSLMLGSHNNAMREEPADLE